MQSTDPRSQPTILLGIARDLVQPRPSFSEPLRGPVHGRIRLLEELVVEIQLRADLLREIMLSANRVGEEVESLVLICSMSAGS
jgi:hypothetical protein